VSIFLDLIVVLIVFSTMYTVIKKGFVRTVIDFASVICALIASKIFANPLSSFFYGILEKVTSKKINEIIENLIRENNLPKTLEEGELFEFLSKYNIDLANKVSGEAVESTMNVITQYLVGILSYAVAFIVVFILTIIAFKIASVVVGGIFELPILKTINKTLALVLAVVMSLFYVLLFIAFMQIILPYLTSVYPDVINNDVINKSLIFDYLYNCEWIKIFVN